MKLSWHGQSTVQIVTDEGHRLIIDPLISENPLSDLVPEDVVTDFILLTHGHNDHIGDTELIAKKNNALIIANFEIANYFEAKDLRTHGMQPGGKFPFDFGTLKMTPAIHSSTYTDEQGSVIPMGIAAGLILLINARTIYHAGDTALFSDMSLIGEFSPIDVAFLPIGDNYTMGPEDAATAAKLLKTKQAVPIHFNTYPVIRQNPEVFSALLPEGQARILEIGEVITL